MKTILSFTSIATLALSGSLSAQTSYSKPSGYVSIECKPNSDTIVGLPLRISAAYTGSLASNPSVTVVNTTAILTLSGTPQLVSNAYSTTHYVKFTNSTPAAAGDGQWFPITANTTNSITIDLRGSGISAVAGAGLEIVKFWTLKELFDPTVSTTDPLTTGNAIVASTSISLGRRSQLLVPPLSGVGTSIPISTAYIIHNGIWKRVGLGDVDYGNDQLWPDSYFIIRHPSSVPSATTYTNSGEVDLSEVDLQLNTQSNMAQDNFIALPRPVDVTLNALNLGGTPAFVSSTSISLGRRDLLYVYDNSIALQNKSPSAIYLYHDGKWKKSGAGDTDFGNDIIKAGSGFLIRKFTSNGSTAKWDNPASY